MRYAQYAKSPKDRKYAVPNRSSAGEVTDIVGIVAFLAGREGGWINGEIIRVNGGYA